MPRWAKRLLITVGVLFVASLFYWFVTAAFFVVNPESTPTARADDPNGRIAQLKTAALQKLERVGIDQLSDRLDAKYLEGVERKIERTSGIVLWLPVIGFVGCLLLPLVLWPRWHRAAPGVGLGRIWGLYLLQAVAVAIVLTIASLAFLLVQTASGGAGVVTDPQLTFKKPTIEFVYNNRGVLLDTYSDVFVGTAQEIAADPDLDLLSSLVRNGERIKNSWVVQVGKGSFGLIHDSLGWFGWLTLALVLPLFLWGLRPTLGRMALRPIELAAPPAHGLASGAGTSPPRTRSPVATLAVEAAREIWIELRVLACFALAIVVFSLIGGALLSALMSPAASFLTATAALNIAYFLRPGASETVIFLSLVGVLIVALEIALLGLVAFLLLMGRLSGGLRDLFSGRRRPLPALKQMARAVGLYLWATVLATVVAWVLIFFVALFGVTSAVVDARYANWGLGLLWPAFTVLFWLNLLLWAGLGFRALWRLQVGPKSDPALIAASALSAEVPPG